MKSVSKGKEMIALTHPRVAFASEPMVEVEEWQSGGVNEGKLG